MDLLNIGLGLLLGLLAGGAIGFFIVRASLNKLNRGKLEELNKKADLEIKNARVSARRLVDDAENKAEKIINKAENKNEEIKQKKILEAKEKYAKLKASYNEKKASHKIEMKEREAEMEAKEEKLSRKLSNFKEKKSDLKQLETELDNSRKNIEAQVSALKKKREETNSLNEQLIKELETTAGISESEARDQLLEAVKAKADTDAMALVKKSVEEARAQANKQAKKIVLQTIQRMCAEYTIENTVTVFKLESDNVKGQIIGREGRNIRALEAATGAEIVVDDTPESVLISSFDPIRRELCRLSLKQLVADGRIHPARIEEVVEKVRQQLDEQIVEIGERIVVELDIHGLEPFLVKMVGRMRFRSSYGQNLLKHSIETANLCGIMAAELGLNKKQTKMAKRAGLLHDIGKVAEDDTELSHALLGMKLAEKHNENKYVCNAIGAHHDEIEMNNIISPIVQSCDAISGARPGARREILESYLSRIGELEELALSHEGVKKAYAMQAGRELRVIVESDKVTDQQAGDLSFMISQKIQDEMQYPGQIKITVIREKRLTAYAK